VHRRVVTSDQGIADAGDGSVVLPYTNDDPVIRRKLEGRGGMNVGLQTQLAVGSFDVALKSATR
jgi:thiazole synthase ThiGH ThiG subunit